MDLTKRLLITILLIFAVVAFLFTSFNLYGDYLMRVRGGNTTIKIEIPDVSDKLKELITVTDAKEGGLAVSDGGCIADPGDPVRRLAVVVSDKNDSLLPTVREWCMYCKYSAVVYLGLPEAETLSGYDLVLFGSYPFAASDAETLTAYGKTGVTLLFTSLPAHDVLKESPALADRFGIGEIRSDAYPIDGIKVFADFYLSSERIYTENDYYHTEDSLCIDIPYYILRPGYKVFAVSVLKNQKELGIKDEKMPPLLWRTYLENSLAYVVGHDLFRGEAMLGTLTAMYSDSERVSVYPILNAQMTSIIGFPWLNIENEENIRAIYGHDPKSLSQNIMLPSIMQVLLAYNGTADYYASAQIDYDLADVTDAELSVYYETHISRRLGTLGLSLDQISKQPLDAIVTRNTDYFAQSMPGYRFSTLYTAENGIGSLLPYLSEKNGLLSDVRLLVCDRSTSTPLVSLVGDGALCAQLVTDGLTYSPYADVAMIATQTALGYSNQYINLKSTLYPSKEEDYWNLQSTAWGSETTYFSEYKAFDSATMGEFGTKAATFLSQSYTRTLDGDTLVLTTDATAPVSFILRLHKDKILRTEGGKVTKLVGSSYLVKPDGQRMTITLEPSHELH